MHKKGIMRQAGPLLVARGAATVLGFGLPLLLVRLLDQTSFGVYKQVWLVATSAFLMLQMGLTASLYYFLPRRDGNGAAYLTQSLASVTVFGALGAFGVYLARFALARHFNTPELAGYAVPMALLAFTLTATTPLEPALLARGQVKLSAATNFVSEIVRVVASIIPLLLGYGLKGFFWAYVAHGVLRCIACVVLLIQTGGPRIDWKLFRGQLAYALPFGAAILFETPQRSLHLWAVGGTVGAAAFAIYSQGCFQIPIVNLLYSPISDVLQVRLNEPGGRGHAVHLFHDANLRLAVILLPFTACMVAAGSLFIPALFTHQYDASILHVQRLLLAAPRHGSVRPRWTALLRDAGRDLGALDCGGRRTDGDARSHPQGARVEVARHAAVGRAAPRGHRFARRLRAGRRHRPVRVLRCETAARLVRGGGGVRRRLSRDPRVPSRDRDAGRSAQADAVRGARRAADGRRS
ncbi:MAG: hypothetical protein E6J62_02025 [Deltaproteobacteria bacterium]|nr:MAG: hypothetical protein E6J62_02025 [Deltaproteobacteria bacterium]